MDNQVSSNSKQVATSSNQAGSGNSKASSGNNRLNRNKYLMAAVMAVLISTVYWSLFGANALGTYHEYTDLGTVVYDMYYRIAFPAAVHGLQYLVFLNHLAPDFVLLVPTFWLAPSALTLLVEQAAIVSGTALVVFLVARDLLKDEKTALLLCLAFLLNPGTQGIFVFDFHPELLLPLFFILTFYFIFKRRPWYFLASLVLLLGALEIASFMALGLGVTMALYALLREKDHAVRMGWLKYSMVTIVLALVAFALYWAAGGALTHAYAVGEYTQLPTLIRWTPGVFSELSLLGASLSSGVLGAYFSSYYLPYLIFALAIVFIGFGIAGLFDPIFAVLFVAPWLGETFIVGNIGFLFTWNQYFSYSLGGSMVIAILALRRSSTGGETKNLLSLLGYREKAWKYIVASILVCSVFLFIISPHFVYSKNVNNIQQDFVFHMNPTVRQQVRQLDSLVALIPKNASVMAPFFTMPQLTLREYFETIPAGQGQFTVAPPNSTYTGQMWFLPDYILADFNPNISLNGQSGYQVQDFLNISGVVITNGVVSLNGSYAIYAYNGSAILLKKKE